MPRARPPRIGENYLRIYLILCGLVFGVLAHVGVKDIGNMNTSKLAALDALDATKTYRAATGSSVEQAFAAAALRAARRPPHDGSQYSTMSDETASYVVLAAGDDLYVTPMSFKTVDHGHRTGSTWTGAADRRTERTRGMAPRRTLPIRRSSRPLARRVGSTCASSPGGRRCRPPRRRRRPRLVVPRRGHGVRARQRHLGSSPWPVEFARARHSRGLPELRVR